MVNIEYERVLSIARASQPVTITPNLRSGKLASSSSDGKGIIIPPSRAVLINTLKKKLPTLAAAKAREDRSKEIPKEFSWKGNELIEKPRDQKLCGSCWAVAIAGVFSDLIAIKTKGELSPHISSTNILSCVAQYQCGGGVPTEAVRTIVETGAVSNECIDYSWCTNNKACAGDPTAHFGNSSDLTTYLNSKIPTCNGCALERKILGVDIPVESEKDLDACTDAVDKSTRCDAAGGNLYKFFAKNMFAIFAEPNETGEVDPQELKNVEYDMKEHLMINGPMVGTYFLTSSFVRGTGWKETDGIYMENFTYPDIDPDNDNSDPSNKTPYKTNGGHAVAMVGWGEENVDATNPSTGKPYGLVKYWVCRNSWGEEWNGDGFWKHAMYPNNVFSQFDAGRNGGEVDGKPLWLGGAAMFEFDRKEDVIASDKPAQYSSKDENDEVSKNPNGGDERNEQSQKSIDEKKMIKFAKIVGGTIAAIIIILVILKLFGVL